VELATTPLHGLWVFAVVVVVALLALSGVGLLISELTVGPPPAIEAPPPATVDAIDLVSTDSGWIARIKGPPGARLVITDGTGATQVVTLDAEGAGISGRLSPSDGQVSVDVAIIEAARSAAVEVAMDPEPTETATVTPTATATATATATHTPPPALADTPSPVPADHVDTPEERDERIVVVPLVWPTVPPGGLRPRTAAAAPPTPTAALATSARISRRPVRNAPPVLHHVADAGPVIALTFDGGASSHRTVELLDLLQELDLRVTLFVTGDFIRDQPALVRRAVLAGHEVGNHTDTHPRLTSYARNRRQDTLRGVDREFLTDELRRAEEAFRTATGRPMVPLWRGPYGEENAALRAWALEAGYLHVRWSSLGGKSLDTLDWVEDEHSRLYRDAEEIARRLLAFPRLEGGIALLHLSTTRTEAPWTHLPDFVAALRDRGITPVQVTDMLEDSPTWSPWLERARTNHRRVYGNDRP
jgi:peptidoglycan/xylan/chitin deacetylase (PgdA/CDA1 family)